jgi:hypothetical protein
MAASASGLITARVTNKNKESQCSGDPLVSRAWKRPVEQGSSRYKDGAITVITMPCASWNRLLCLKTTADQEVKFLCIVTNAFICFYFIVRIASIEIFEKIGFTKRRYS